MKFEDLKPEWQVFVTEYLKDFNATRSYMVAYPNSAYNSAMTRSSELLRNVKVKEYIEEQQKKRHDDSIMSREELLRYLTRVVRDEETEEVLMSKALGKGVTDVVRKNKRVAARDRNKAAELLAKSYGMLTDKTENKTTATVKVDESWFEEE